MVGSFYILIYFLKHLNRKLIIIEKEFGLDYKKNYNLDQRIYDKISITLKNDQVV